MSVRPAAAPTVVGDGDSAEAVTAGTAATGRATAGAGTVEGAGAATGTRTGAGLGALVTGAGVVIFRLVFGGLLVGRWRYGWRGAKAVHWTLTAMALLLLAFFGSKFVYELVLHRG